MLTAILIVAILGAACSAFSVYRILNFQTGVRKNFSDLTSLMLEEFLRMGDKQTIILAGRSPDESKRLLDQLVHNTQCSLEQNGLFIEAVRELSKKLDDLRCNVEELLSDDDHLADIRLEISKIRNAMSAREDLLRSIRDFLHRAESYQSEHSIATSKEESERVVEAYLKVAKAVEKSVDTGKEIRDFMAALDAKLTRMELDRGIKNGYIKVKRKPSSTPVPKPSNKTPSAARVSAKRKKKRSG